MFVCVFRIKETQATSLKTFLHEIASEKYNNDEEAAAAVFEGGPAALPFSRFDTSTRDLVKRQYIETIQPYKKPNGCYAIPGEFVIGTGIK